MKIKEGNICINPFNENDWEFMKLIPKLTKDIDKFKEKNLSEAIWDENEKCYIIPINELSIDISPEDFSNEDWRSLEDYQDNLVDLLSADSRRQIAKEYIESELKFEDIKNMEGIGDMIGQLKMTDYMSVSEIFDKLEIETNGKAFNELLNRFDKDQLLDDAGYDTDDILKYLKKKGMLLDIIKEYVSSQDLMRFMDDIKISVKNAFQYIWCKFKKKLNELEIR